MDGRTDVGLRGQALPGPRGLLLLVFPAGISRDGSRVGRPRLSQTRRWFLRQDNFLQTVKTSDLVVFSRSVCHSALRTLRSVASPGWPPGWAEASGLSCGARPPGASDRWAWAGRRPLLTASATGPQPPARPPLLFPAKCSALHKTTSRTDTGETPQPLFSTPQASNPPSSRRPGPPAPSAGSRRLRWPWRPASLSLPGLCRTQREAVMHFYVITFFYLNPCSGHQLLFNKNDRGPLLPKALLPDEGVAGRPAHSV